MGFVTLSKREFPYAAWKELVALKKLLREWKVNRDWPKLMSAPKHVVRMMQDQAHAARRDIDQFNKSRLRIIETLLKVSLKAPPDMLPSLPKAHYNQLKNSITTAQEKVRQHYRGAIY